MKRAILAFLTLLILMPGLVCAMPSCQDGIGKSPCPHHTAKGAAVPMLMQDCTKADLQKSPDIGVKKPDLLNQIFTVAAATIAVDDFSVAAVRSIHGPPPDWPTLSQTKPSIILTTQRFRE